MFTQTWREHWGLSGDPFACEDADKDPVLGRVETSAVHSGFDRVFGDPASPAPGIVFGEKGSGKSGLRLMMRRRLAAHNQAHPDARVFVVEYADFDGYLESLQRTLAHGKKRADTREVLSAWRLSDHLDAILSLSVTALVDGLLDGQQRMARPSTKQALDLHLLTALYYRSKARTPSEALEGLNRSLGAPGRSPAVGRTRRVFLSLLGAALVVAPELAGSVPALEPLAALQAHRPLTWGVAAAIALLPWAAEGLRDRKRATFAARACHALRVLPTDPAPLHALLRRLGAMEQGELLMPQGDEEAVRFEYLQRTLALLAATGNHGLYVLVDRVDEPTLLADGGERMRDFVSSMLDIKLLQHPQLALKLFLPIEMESLWRSASAEQLKRMRLDKSNLVPELKWTGRELYEIANQRLLACAGEGGRAGALLHLLGDDLPLEHMLETFSTLGTPRYAFGFLSEVLLEHVKELPEDLGPDDPRWRLSRSGFDVVRAGWIDRAGILRRTLN